MSPGCGGSYPLEFMVAVINNEGGFYQRWVYVAEARKAGASIHLPCVGNSELKTCIRGSDIYLGFNIVGSLQAKSIDSILGAREQSGAFLSLEDLLLRTGISQEQLLILINAGALRFTGKDKKQLLWLAHLQTAGRQPRLKAQPTLMPGVLSGPAKAIEIPPFEVFDDETFFDEIESLGFSLTLSPFHLLRTGFRGEVMARDLLSFVGQTVKMVGLYVTAKPTPDQKEGSHGLWHLSGCERRLF